ncbi:uncharacterized protein [Centruroides vittatus]|uniref:uncharacterized protein n=1 Tax=Centruroides vittatus TaxID=120091 RepID=UPI00350F90DE
MDALPEVTVLVPLHPPHGCRLCLPIPRDYSDHAGLVKHLKHVHGTKLRFECRACGLIQDRLKDLKAHQVRAESCKASIEAMSPPPPIPADRKILCIPTRPRKRYSTKKRRRAAQSQASNDDSLDEAESPNSSNTTPPRPRRSTKSIQRAQPSETAQPEHHSPSPGYLTRSSRLRPLPTNCLPPPDVNPPAATTEPQQPTLTPELSYPTRPTAAVLASPQPQNHNLPRLEVRLTPLQLPPNAQLSFTSSRSNSPLQPATTPAAEPEIATPAEARSDNSTPHWVLAWKERFDSAMDEDMLENILGDLTNLLYDMCKVRPINLELRPNNRHRQSNHHQDITQNASEIQKLYRANKKRAFSTITGGNNRYCTIDESLIREHFTSVLGTTPATTTPAPLDNLPPPTSGNNPLESPFTPGEVADRLRRGRNTAPGPDGFRYSHWRRMDPEGYIIAAIFNAVRRTGHIPYAWRMSTTILAHKKGPLDDISNWRPISLSCTIGKLYTACLANRLLKWCEQNDRLSPAQKGFVHYEGCQDHNYILQTTIQDARRQRKSCHIAWLDLCNAFGSIPHETLWRSLEWIGLHHNSIDIIKTLYTGGSTRVRTNSGYLPPIPILSGVRQGCPISPILFNIALEVGIRMTSDLNNGYELYGNKFNILAYADDVTLISDTEQGLADQLQKMETWANWAGVRFNPAKCASLSVDGKAHTTSKERFRIQGEYIPSLGPGEVYSHLGVPTGFATGWTSPKLIDSILNDLDKLHNSKLAPWQRIDAVNTFLIPRLIFHLTLGTTPKKAMDKLDKSIKTKVKRWLNLPNRASNEVLYMANSQGGANLLPCSTLADVAQVCHAVRIFNSRDNKVRETAINALTTVVKKRIGRTPTPEDCCTYLNGSTEHEFGGSSKDIRSAWTRLRAASRRLWKWMPVQWHPGEDGPILLHQGNLINKNACSRLLNTLIRHKHLQSLLRKPDQGKAFNITASNWESNHYMREGKYTQFADWRFVHRARLSVVPLRGHRRFGNLTKKCRRCNHANETLAHVLCHCPSNMVAITRRHNGILNRLVTATDKRNARTYINQRIPEYDQNCRPDFVIINDASKSATIIDVATPFENGTDAFTRARDEKIHKYRDLANFFRSRGYDTFIDAFIVGALGGYDTANEATLRRLAIHRNYAKVMKKLMVSENIKHSREIYIRHLEGGRRQINIPQQSQDNPRQNNPRQ